MQDNREVAQIVSNNLVRLMRASEPLHTLEKLSERSAVSTSAISRTIRLETMPSIELLDKLATAFGLEAWQLLVDGLDPHNPQSLTTLPHHNNATSTDAAWLFSEEATKWIPKKAKSED